MPSPSVLSAAQLLLRPSPSSAQALRPRGIRSMAPVSVGVGGGRTMRRFAVRAAADESSEARRTEGPIPPPSTPPPSPSPPPSSEGKDEASASAPEPEPAEGPIKYQLISPAGKSRYEIAPGQQFEVFTAGAQVIFRAGSAAFVSPNINRFRRRPEKLLELYEFEGCPFCRKVREAVTILDLDVLFYPCPKDGPTWRPKAVQLSGKRQFPFLVDPNNGRQLLESDEIVAYLWEEYGDGKANIPIQLTLGLLTNIGCGLGLLPRAGRGSRYRKSKLPEKPLILWAYEASPFCKLTREVLTELEIPHIYKSVARNSPKRSELIDKHGVFQVPYLEDPNTGLSLFETKAVNEYIVNTYAA